MLLITKRLAEAIVSRFRVDGGIYPDCCIHCDGSEYAPDWKIRHEDSCIVLEAKLLLEKEWSIENA
jgi:hypothetical protein